MKRARIYVLREYKEIIVRARISVLRKSIEFFIKSSKIFIFERIIF